MSDEPKSWAESIKRYENETRSRTVERVVPEKVFLRALSTEWRKMDYHPIHQMHLDPTKEANLKKREDAKLERQASAAKNRYKSEFDVRKQSAPTTPPKRRDQPAQISSAPFDILSGAEMPASHIQKLGPKSRTTGLDHFDARQPSPTKSTKDQREFNIVSTQYKTNHEARAQAEAETTRHKKLEQLSEEREFNPVSQMCNEPVKEEALRKREKEKVQKKLKEHMDIIPQSYKKSSGHAYDVTSGEARDAEALAALQAEVTVMRERKKQIVEKREQYMAALEDLNFTKSERSKNRVSSERYREAYKNGYDLIDGRPYENPPFTPLSHEGLDHFDFAPHHHHHKSGADPHWEMEPRQAFVNPQAGVKWAKQIGDYYDQNEGGEVSHQVDSSSPTRPARHAGSLAKYCGEPPEIEPPRPNPNPNSPRMPTAGLKLPHENLNLFPEDHPLYEPVTVARPPSPKVRRPFSASVVPSQKPPTPKSADPTQKPRPKSGPPGGRHIFPAEDRVQPALLSTTHQPRHAFQENGAMTSEVQPETVNWLSQANAQKGYSIKTPQQQKPRPIPSFGLQAGWVQSAHQSEQSKPSGSSSSPSILTASNLAGLNAAATSTPPRSVPRVPTPRHDPPPPLGNTTTPMFKRLTLNGLKPAPLELAPERPLHMDDQSSPAVGGGMGSSQKLPPFTTKQLGKVRTGGFAK